MNKKITAAIASFAMLACTLSGCATKSPAAKVEKLRNDNYYISEKVQPLEYNTLSFNYLGGKDVMPIGGFYGPYASGGSIDGYKFPQLIDEKYYKLISEAGLNMIVYSADYNKSNVRRSLELGGKYGIGQFANCSLVDVISGRLDKTKGETLDDAYHKGDPLPFTEQDLYNEIKDLLEFDSLLGIRGADEPFWYQLDGLAEVSKMITDIGYGDTRMYVNALGYGGGDLTYGGWEENITQEQYFEKLFTDVKLPFLSATGYFYTQKDTPDKDLSIMFPTLSSIRSLANKYGVPMWRMLQAGGQWNDEAVEKESVDYYPNEGELLFDVNIALCYGCKAIQYFPLISPLHFAYAPDGTYDFNRNGLISAAGSINEWYYYAQKANKQIAAIDHVLMNSANAGMIVHGANANELARTADEGRDELIRDGKFRQLTSVSGDDCFVGCFDYLGGTALYVVNYSRKSKANVTLNFDKTYGYEVIQRAVSAEVAAKNLPLTLEAGEGVLVVLK